MFLPGLLLALASTCGGNGEPGAVPLAKPAEEAAAEPPSYFTGADPKKWPDPVGKDGYWPTPSADPSQDAADHGPNDSILQKLESEQAKQTLSVLKSCLIALSWAIGIAMLVAGLSPSRSGPRGWWMCLAIVPLTLLSFCAYGFAIGWGNWFNAPVPPGWYSSLGPGMSVLNEGIGLGGNPATSEFKYGLIGTTGFFVHGFENSAVLHTFCLMWAMFCIAATLSTAALAGRWSWKSLCMFGTWVALPYGLLANWMWGGGWLAQAGKNWGLGHGVADFAGSGLTYGLGGIIALAGCLVLGPRPSKSTEGEPQSSLVPIFQSAILGLLILLAPNLDANFEGGGPFGAVAMNSNLAKATAASVVALALWLRRRKLDLVMIGCGGLSGLAAISGPCGFVNAAAAAVIGGVAGIVFMASASFLERRGIDDVIRVVSAFGAGGLWGMIAVGLFANGKYGHGWNGVVRDNYVTQSGMDGVRGLFYGDASQFAMQLLAVCILLTVGFGLSFSMFKLSNWIAPARLPAAAAHAAQSDA